MAGVNQLRFDPTRTTLIRRAFLSQMDARFARLQADIRDFVITQDCFGLDPNHANPVVFNSRAFQFETDSRKVPAFNDWLQGQIETGVLSSSGGLHDGKWTDQYVDSAYRKGVVRAYTDTKKNKSTNTNFGAGKRSQFLADSFDAAESKQKIQLLATRTFGTLKGVTDAMSARINTVLAAGIANRDGPLVIARAIEKQVADIGINRARTIARTEVIHAHAEGQLDTFERLGVEELGIYAEYSTAGDTLVCPLCQPLEGIVIPIKQARGMIPRHANCRCSWLPAEGDDRQTGQKWGPKAAKAIDKSVLAESPNAKDLTQARKKSVWVGADKTPVKAATQAQRDTVATAKMDIAAQKAATKAAEPTPAEIVAKPDPDNLRFSDLPAFKKLQGKQPERESVIREILNTHGHSAFSQPSHNTALPEVFKSVKIEGIVFRYSDQTKEKAVYTIEALSRESMPKPLINAVYQVTFNNQPNINDAHWAFMYKMPGFKSGATGGGGGIDVYNGLSMSTATFAHEAGHNLAGKLWGQSEPLPESEYGKAQIAEKPVSSYGAVAPAEDFAEAVALFVTNPRFLKSSFPHKFAALEKLLGSAP